MPSLVRRIALSCAALAALAGCSSAREHSYDYRPRDPRWVQVGPGTFRTEVEALDVTVGLASDPAGAGSPVRSLLLSNRGSEPVRFLVDRSQSTVERRPAAALSLWRREGGAWKQCRGAVEVPPGAAPVALQSAPAAASPGADAYRHPEDGGALGWRVAFVLAFERRGEVLRVPGEFDVAGYEAVREWNMPGR